MICLSAQKIPILSELKTKFTECSENHSNIKSKLYVYILVIKNWILIKNNTNYNTKNMKH